MTRYLPLLLTAVLVAGCATPAERAARLQAEMESMMRVYGPACTQLGYSANTDQWRDCVLRLSAQEDMERYGRYPHYYAGYGPSHWRFGGVWGPYW